MGKLYELLAVEGAKKEAFGKILTETKTVFKKKQSHFTGAVKVYEPFAEADHREAGVSERHEMTTTVHAKLDYMLAQVVVPYLDAMYQKEIGNQSAMGALTINGEEIFGIPATFLLGLEGRLKSIREVLNEIPTHPAGTNWVVDEAHQFAPNAMKGEHSEETNRTKKVLVPFELSPATKEHKAQVKELTEDRVIGKFITEIWSSMYTPKQKSAMLSRIDILIENVNRARMQANAVEAPTAKIGVKIAAFLLKEVE